MPSFDVVSEIDTHELTNAVDQAIRELGQRFDFKGTDAAFELEETTVTMIAAGRLSAQADAGNPQAQDSQARHRRRLSRGEGSGDQSGRAKQLVILKHGIDAEAGRKMSRLIKDSKLKVQAQIQGDKVRVTGKKRDDLQEAIAFLRKADARRAAAIQ